jgi:nucleoside-diphosphate-sugar epimerase
MPIAREVFITGGTGYTGRPLIEMLRQRGHRVLALARPGSEGRLPSSCACLVGNALAAGTFSERVPAGCTAVENPPKHQRIIEVPEIRTGRWDRYSSTRVVGA